MDTPIVSFLVVVRNGEEKIVQAIDAILEQGLKKPEFEVLILDGLSEDSTVSKAKRRLEKEGVTFKIIQNKGLTLASGWNLGIKSSRGRFIVRPDVHSKLLKGYVSTAIQYLRKDKTIAGIGGVWDTRSDCYMGNIISKVLSNPIGVGASKFRIGIKKDSQTDTIAYGVYRREIFNEIGFFNETLKRNQDIDLHKRILKKGYTLLTSPRMKAVYYCRRGVKPFLKQAFQNGYWVTFGSGWYVRHLVPLAFLIAICSLSVYSSWIAAFIFAVYVGLNILSYAVISKIFNPITLVIVIWLTFAMHCVYGLGSLVGITRKMIEKIAYGKN